MQKNRLYLYSFLFGGITVVLFALLAFTTARNSIRDKALLMQNALAQGYWIARSLEIGHTMTREDHPEVMRKIFKEIEKQAAVRLIAIVDKNRHVLLASHAVLEGTRWPDELGEPSHHGRIIRRDARTIALAFPAFFAELLQSMSRYHSHHDGSLDTAKWIILELDASEASAHYRDGIVQSVFVSLGTIILGLAAFFFFGMIQKYQLASTSIEKLESIKRHLTRFVPHTVQRLIEDNPEKPLLDKVECDATVLFLDVEEYTKISEEVSPEALNRLIEKYFSVFLDIIHTNGGEINETAGDGIMAIFTGKTQRTHALNAVRAALAIRERAGMLNGEKAPPEPEILINIGINTGEVLLGATMIKGAVGERFTYTASGMVTNIASRLCGLGTKGEIHLSYVTAQLVKDHFTLHGPFEVHLKNVREAMPVYQLA